MRFILPNLLTLGNLACGSAAIALSYEREWLGFALLIGGALLLDWLDGFVARQLRAESPLGKELDALADLATFGVAPAFALYNYLRPWLPELTYAAEARFTMILMPFILPLAAAWRLARFNAFPTKSTAFFEGLPTPAQGLFWAAWLLSRPSGIWLHPIVWNSLILGISLSMISRWPCLSLKTRQNLLPLLLWASAGGLILSRFSLSMALVALLLGYLGISGLLAYSRQRRSP
ncbi:MAG: CDP-alcohol phosphatidyltransferase family protein [Bacteroidia bacterium]|nr:CDP-alcohol phosphatidyltransferase family protein [Bacteroidia bacterium]MDW8088865.1 CDP-alcohol phosphatidyltransferase family protein [Bacteroidia bacterium]